MPVMMIVVLSKWIQMWFNHDVLFPMIQIWNPVAKVATLRK